MNALRAAIWIKIESLSIMVPRERGRSSLDFLAGQNTLGVVISSGYGQIGTCLMQTRLELASPADGLGLKAVSTLIRLCLAAQVHLKVVDARGGPVAVRTSLPTT